MKNDIQKRLTGWLIILVLTFTVISLSTSPTEAASKTYNLDSHTKQVVFTISYKGSIFKKDYSFRIINRGNGAAANVFVYKKLVAGGNQYLTNINGGHEQSWSGKANQKFSETYIIQKRGGGNTQITVETSDNLSIN